MPMPGPIARAIGTGITGCAGWVRFTWYRPMKIAATTTAVPIRHAAVFSVSQRPRSVTVATVAGA